MLCNRSVFLCERQVNRKEETDDRLRRKIRDKLSVVPFEPGCYLMKDRNDQIIYVGKAKRLRNRLRSYFTGAHDAKLHVLLVKFVTSNLL